MELSDEIAVSGDDGLILDWNLLQAFATVSLSRDPITSLIFLIRSSVLLLGAAFTFNSVTAHTK
jgi:hypothetical protein